jgi:hypothetical protein
MKESGGEFTVNGKSLARFDFWINFCYEYVTSDVAMEIFHSVLRDFFTISVCRLSIIFCLMSRIFFSGQPIGSGCFAKFLMFMKLIQNEEDFNGSG